MVDLELAQLSIQISTLRRAFVDAGCDRELIETTLNGYRLTDQDLRIDALEAERLQSEAQDLPDAEDAADRLRAALALWRGVALQDLATRELSAGAHRLAELRLTIAEPPGDARDGWHRSAAILFDLGLITAAEKRSIDSSAAPTAPDLIGRNT